MNKIVLLIAGAVYFSCITTFAQTKTESATGFRLGIGPDFAFPADDFATLFNVGYGLSLQLQTPVRKNLNFTVSAGYLEFHGKRAVSRQGTTRRVDNIGILPLKAGVNYHLVEYFYLGGQLGAALGVKNFNETTVFYAPNFGVEFPMSDKKSIDLNVRYEAAFTDRPFGPEGAFVALPRFVGLRLGYNFGL